MKKPKESGLMDSGLQNRHIAAIVVSLALVAMFGGVISLILLATIITRYHTIRNKKTIPLIVMKKVIYPHGLRQMEKYMETF